MTTPDLAHPPARPIEWRVRLASGPWMRLKPPLLFVRWFDAPAEAARRLGVAPECLTVERVQ